jgi:hypothetical protein
VTERAGDPMRLDSGARVALVGDDEIPPAELVDEVLLTYQRGALGEGTDPLRNLKRMENPCRQ